MPCNPQPAQAELNSLTRDWPLGPVPPQAALTARSCAVSACEPGQVRKEAALSGSRHVMQASLARAKSSGHAREPRLEDGCTVHYFAPGRSRSAYSRGRRPRSISPAASRRSRRRHRPIRQSPCRPACVSETKHPALHRPSGAVERSGRPPLEVLSLRPRRSSRTISSSSSRRTAMFPSTMKRSRRTSSARDLRPGREHVANALCEVFVVGHGGQPRRRIDSIRGRIRLSLSPSPPAELRGGRRPGAHRAHALERGREGPRPSRLPVRRLARDRQDLDGEDPRPLAQLRRTGRP